MEAKIEQEALRAQQLQANAVAATTRERYQERMDVETGRLQRQLEDTVREREAFRDRLVQMQREAALGADAARLAVVETLALQAGSPLVVGALVEASVAVRAAVGSTADVAVGLLALSESAVVAAVTEEPTAELLRVQTVAVL